MLSRPARAAAAEMGPLMPNALQFAHETWLGGQQTNRVAVCLFDSLRRLAQPMQRSCQVAPNPCMTGPRGLQLEHPLQ